MPEVDPLVGFKLAAATYGIPPETVNTLAGWVSDLGALSRDLVEAHLDATRAAEIERLAAAGRALHEVGQNDLAHTLYNEIRARIMPPPGT